MIRELTWDSQFFGIRTAEWDADEGVVGNTEAFDLIYVKSDKAANPEIDGFEKTFAETKVVFTKELNEAKAGHSAICNANSNDNIEILYALAYESGNYSRFRLDEKFGGEKFRKLYDAWIDNSLSGAFADEVLVYIDENKPVGLVTYKKRETYAVIGLIAVDADSQGKGIGKQLLDFVEARLIEQEIKELRIPTQLENKQACGFYAKQGYTVFETKHIMHYWRQ
jgi:ribosomal protein S18 acetylase RimI-like enzyme